MNNWRRHIATGSVVMALGVASMVPSLALAANNSYDNQDTGTSSSQHMNNSSGSSGSMGSSGKMNSNGNMGSKSNMNSGGSMGSSGSNTSSGSNMGSSGSNTNSGGNMGSGGSMNSSGSMGSGGMMNSGGSMSRNNVMHVQKALNQAGYNLSVDGMMGPHTRSALKKYQQSHGLHASGKPTPQTMQKLGVSQ